MFVFLLFYEFLMWLPILRTINRVWGANGITCRRRCSTGIAEAVIPSPACILGYSRPKPPSQDRNKSPRSVQSIKESRILPGLPNDSRAEKGALRSWVLTRKNHNLPAVHTGDIDHFRSPDRISTARADIFPAVGWFWSYRGHSSATVSASTGDRNSVVVVPGNQNVC